MSLIRSVAYLNAPLLLRGSKHKVQAPTKAYAAGFQPIAQQPGAFKYNLMLRGDRPEFSALITSLEQWGQGLAPKPHV